MVNRQHCQPTIQVNTPAQYWLEVTNADGCTNREFINVKHKHCRNSIDFPNAFTPNNDRHNDTYKPVVKGLLVSIQAHHLQSLGTDHIREHQSHPLRGTAPLAAGHRTRADLYGSANTSLLGEESESGGEELYY